MAKYNRNSGKTWTTAEEHKIPVMARQNTPTRVMGLKLGRTEDAIRNKANELGVSLAPWNRSPYGKQK